MKNSPKTSAAAIALILATVGQVVYLMVDGDPGTNPDWTMAMSSIIAAIGFFFARDNDKSSEDVGIK